MGAGKVEARVGGAGTCTLIFSLATPFFCLPTDKQTGGGRGGGAGEKSTVSLTHPHPTLSGAHSHSHSHPQGGERLLRKFCCFSSFLNGQKSKVFFFFFFFFDLLHNTILRLASHAIQCSIQYLLLHHGGVGVGVRYNFISVLFSWYSTHEIAFTNITKVAQIKP